MAKYVKSPNVSVVYVHGRRIADYVPIYGDYDGIPGLIKVPSDEERHALLDEMVRESEAAGLYELEAGFINSDPSDVPVRLNLDAGVAAADDLFAQMQTPAVKDGARAAVEAIAPSNSEPISDESAPDSTELLPKKKGGRPPSLKKG